MPSTEESAQFMYLVISSALGAGLTSVQSPSVLYYAVVLIAPSGVCAVCDGPRADRQRLYSKPLPRLHANTH